MALNFYKVLCIDSVASTQDIRVAFKRAALEVHPDKGGCKEAFQLVLLAFETLSDERARAKHDRGLACISSCARPSKSPSGWPSSPVPAAARTAARAAARADSAAEARAKSSHQQARAQKVGSQAKAGSSPLAETTRAQEARRPTKRMAMDKDLGPAKSSSPVQASQGTPPPPCPVTSKAQCSIGGEAVASAPAMSAASRPAAVPAATPTGPSRPIGGTDRSGSTCGSGFVASSSAKEAPRAARVPTPTNAHVAEDIPAKIFVLLQRLSKEGRAVVIREKLGQPLRLALEARIVALRQAAGTQENHSLVHVTSSCSSDGESQSEEDGERLALCRPCATHSSSSPSAALALEDGSSHAFETEAHPRVQSDEGSDQSDVPESLHDLAGKEYSCEMNDVSEHDHEEADVDDVVEDDNSSEQDVAIEAHEGGTQGAAEGLVVEHSLETSSPSHGKPKFGQRSTRMRGIIRITRRECNNYYRAFVNVAGFKICSRWSAELSVSLEALIVLTAVKVGIASSDVEDSFAGKVTTVLLSVLEEQRSSQEELGLTFCTQFQHRILARCILETPTCQNLAAALSINEGLQAFRNYQKGRPRWQERLLELVNFNAEWEAFGSGVVALIKRTLGQSKSCGMARTLERLCGKASSYRDALRESYERQAMANAEGKKEILAASRRTRWQEARERRAMASEDRSRRRVTTDEQRQALHERHSARVEARGARAAQSRELKAMWHEDRRQQSERRLERKNRRLLAREDRRSRKWQKRLRADKEWQLHTEPRFIWRICCLAERWRRRQKRRHICEGRDRAAARRAAAAEAKMVQRSLLEARREKWRRLNRPDITVAEMLSERG
mmetsp:Transcript_126384/g.404636  ORF Transcript_126384/g.404636 Transcript_126384/m.404636 type:complete len:845 (-) Transcript_126384:337-2871(-)